MFDNIKEKGYIHSDSSLFSEYYNNNEPDPDIEWFQNAQNQQLED